NRIKNRVRMGKASANRLARVAYPVIVHILRLGAIIAVGIASRLVHTGWILLDKYLGDALYAAMVYALISLFWRATPLRRAVAAMLIMTAIETFQLTLIPAHLLSNPNLVVRVAARLMGTEFSVRDLLAYLAGI